MNTWVLILSIAIGGSSREGTSVSVHSVDGFTSLNSCLAAGNQWLKQTREFKFTYTGPKRTALCVKK